MVMGPWGAGKSYAWVRIAYWFSKGKEGDKVYVVDTDATVERQSLAFDGFDKVVIGKDAPNYTYLISALDECLLAAYPGKKIADIVRQSSMLDARKSPLRDSFLVVDLADKPWEYSQNYYIEEAYGKEAADYYLEFKKAGKGGNALADAYGTNWQIVNKHYDHYMNRVLKWPGHLMLCCPADEIRQADSSGKGGEQDKEILSAFGKYKVKPAGQKRVGFVTMTNLLLNPVGDEKWKYTSMKDLHRERPKGAEIKDFALDYLVKVAGWRM